MIAGARGGRLVMLNTITSMLSCAVGGWVNNYSIRSPEVQRGIAIFDPVDGQTVGVSQVCASSARLQTANSRIMMAVPMALPAATLMAIERLGVAPRNNRVMFALKMSLITLQLLVSLPMSMACYPQFQKISAEHLEEKFHNLRSELTGQLIREFHYNKGL